MVLLLQNLGCRGLLSHVHLPLLPVSENFAVISNENSPLCFVDFKGVLSYWFYVVLCQLHMVFVELDS